MTEGLSNDREMLIRIDERVRGLVQEVQNISSNFRDQYAAKAELTALAARTGRLEWMVNLVTGAVVVAIIGAIMTVILKGSP